MAMKEYRQYGYLTPENNNCRVRMMKGQNIAGYSVGILYIEDVYYPMMPGNVVNAYTYDFPVRLKAVAGLTSKRLFCGEDSIFDDLLAAAKELEREGVRAISAACGFNRRLPQAK